MKLVGITRIRNEEGIIQNTLDHVAKFVDEVYVYDDASTDNTAEICENHKIVSEIFKNYTWDSSVNGRAKAEGIMRQTLYEVAVRNGADWVYCFDADEYIEFNQTDWKADSYFFRLFDFYITPHDIGEPYSNRQFMGPEYRDIPMLFWANNKIKFKSRVPQNYGKAEFGGYVRHYGKAISVEQWDKDCDYYSEIRWKGKNEELQKRWKERKGKAIHTESDFGRPLITWEDKFDLSKIVAI